MKPAHHIRTNSSNSDFRKLIKQLDELLVIFDGSEHDFYDQFNQLDDIKYVVLIYQEDEPIGCGAIKKFDDNSFEIKRMFVSSIHRGNGIATYIIAELERWAHEFGANRCVLETGKRMTSAVNLYQKNSYVQIPNYGQYIGMDNSVCFEKVLA